MYRCVSIILVLLKNRITVTTTITRTEIFSTKGAEGAVQHMGVPAWGGLITMNVLK